MSYKGFDLHGRIAVVVGGTSGIGQTIGHGLAEAGADVIPTGRRADLVEAAAGEIEALGQRSLRISSDVLNRGSLQSLLDAVVAKFGKVDILVNAAGHETHSVSGSCGKRMERDYGDEPDRGVPRQPDFRPAYGRTKVRPDYPHRIAGILCRLA